MSDDDPVRAFRLALGREMDSRLNISAAVVGLVHAAVTNHGWTPKQLADECARDLGDVVNAGAVITERLRKAATHPPVGARAAFGPKLPFCGNCEAGWLVDPETCKPIARCDCRRTSP